MALLDDLPTSAIAGIVQRLSPRLYIDFIRHLPAEICLKILGFLDPVSLVSVLRTCRAWYDLALDRKLWERLYHLEGWKAIHPEIDASEVRINESLDASLGQLIRAPSPEGHANKIRAILNEDEDLEMTDSASTSGFKDSFSGNSIFGSPSSSFSSSRKAITPVGEYDRNFPSKGKNVERSFSVSEGSAKRKAPEGSPEPMYTAPETTEASSLFRSTLWSWDVSSSRYRINWKYLYNMRRRLESNWELGKYKPFMLPHPQHPGEGHKECVYTIQFDGNYLVSGSRDRTMRIWNMKTRRLVRAPLMGHRGSVLCLQFDADPDEDIIVSGSSDSNVHIWKFSTGELLQSLVEAHHESVLNVRFDKNILVTSSKDKTIKIFNRRVLIPGDMGHPKTEPVVNPVGRSVRAYGYEPELGHELAIKPYTMIGGLIGHGAAVNAIQVRGRSVVSVSGDRQIKIWDWPKRVCTQTIPAHDKGIACVEYDERRIVSGSSDFEVCIFDAPTGLKVASLRGHANLVRTVQAGFGDLPYSKIEDEKEARQVDEAYLKALESGEVSTDGDRASRRSRGANPGSSRPADVQTVGAKVPPGGGGGRKYGRIVSGSYDQSIIVWRRDKEGVWKPAHHLRQEEASEQAQRESVLTRHQIASALDETTLPMHLAAGSSSSGEHAPPGGPESQATAAHSAGLYMALIDQVVPRGVAALQQALASYPSLLIYHTYLQSAIEREVSPFVRAQLREAVTSALVTIQTAQSARHGLRQAINAPTAMAMATSSTGATAGSSTSNTSEPPDMATPQPLPAVNVPISGLQTPVPAPALPVTVQASIGQRHPHIAPAENAPARVFKLQFDAHKIVCCTQAPIIVGWDFCDGDPELEEASRFFATVD